MPHGMDQHGGPAPKTAVRIRRRLWAALGGGFRVPKGKIPSISEEGLQKHRYEELGVDPSPRCIAVLVRQVPEL